MNCSISKDQLLQHTARQLAFFSPSPENAILLGAIFDKAFARVETAFRQIKGKYYSNNGTAQFNHLHGDHYAIYLYYLSNEASRNGMEELAQQIFYLNKMLNGLDLFYANAMPEVFLLVHPVGTVLGNAQYGNFFAVYQNCTVGSLDDGKYPVFKGETIMYSKSSVIGDCTVGKNVIFAANAFILNTDVPDNTTVVGCYPHHRLLPSKKSVMDILFLQPAAMRDAAADSL